MSGLEVGQVVTATLPDEARRLGLPGEVTGLVIRLEQDGGNWFVFVEVREPARFAGFVVRLPTRVVAGPDPARCRGTQEAIRTAVRREEKRVAAPRLYTHADFDGETLTARGEALPFVPRSERQWAYALLMASFVEWVEIDAPGAPAPIRIVVRLDDQAGLVDEPLADVTRLVDVHRRPGEVWEISTFVPGLNRR